jgi:hypothetical protein
MLAGHLTPSDRLLVVDLDTREWEAFGLTPGATTWLHGRL